MARHLRIALSSAAVALVFVGTALAHTVNVDSLNVRTGPGYGYSIIGTLSRGTVVNTVSTSGSWTKINSPKTGWVYSSYLANTSHTTTTSSVGFINLPTSGYGWTSYRPSSELWGKPRMINGLISIARRWKDGYPGVKGHTITVGGISLKNGGYFPPHQTHRLGVDVDLTPITTSGSASYSYYGCYYYSSNYSLYYTRLYVKLQRSTWSVKYMCFNDSRVAGATYCSGHSSHMHTDIY